jgi:hypothetical protein
MMYDSENDSMIVDNPESENEDEKSQTYEREGAVKSNENSDDEVGEQFEYTDNDLDEALLAENHHDNNFRREKEDQKEEKMREDEPMTPINEPTEEECHYLPMTPKKAILSSSASETSILAIDILNSIRSSTDVIEENPYIEMSNALSSSSEKIQPYDLALLSDKKDNYEPLYMELAAQSSSLSSDIGLKEQKMQCDKTNVSNTNKKVMPESAKTATLSKKQARIKKRSSHDLPDILKQSSQNYIKSESSSDADDEDVPSEPITLKSRTRFSLSDTFRPASYYLGASTSSSSVRKNVPLAECLDSSDSEIVPPPPIPSTSPPLNSEEVFSCENFNTIKRNSTTSNEIIHQRTMSAGSSQLSEKIASRFSLQDSLFKQQQQKMQQQPTSSNASGYLLNLPQFEKLKNAKNFSTASNCSINTDDGSNTSSDFDLYNKIKLQSPSISADSLNQSQTSLTDSSPRPRPIVSEEDALFKFEEQNANENLDHYLNKLETNDLFYSKEQTSWLSESMRHATSMDPISSLHYENINLIEQQQQQQQQKLKTKSKQFNSIYYDSLEDVNNGNASGESFSQHSLLPDRKLSAQNDASSFQHQQYHEDVKNKNLNRITPTQIDVDTTNANFEMTQHTHSRTNSNLSDTSSYPYYYSDLASDTIETLNNQRDVHGMSLKKNSNYISHIHNLINTNQNKQQLTSILKDQAEKEQGIDSRNIYDSGSGRLQKFVNKIEPTATSLLANDFANNKIYYHEKNTNVAAAAATNSIVSSPTMAIDNLLYAKNENLNSSTDVGCDQLWEEDAIWSENLRRVSQRHAHSLDDLDRIESISTSAVTKARISDADKKWGVNCNSLTMERKSRNTSISSGSGGKITREVTYVNEEHQRTLTRKRTKSYDTSKLDENDVYVQLACDTNQPMLSSSSQSDVYEILRDDTNVDRENIRQWDMISSGAIKSSRAQHRAHSSMDATMKISSLKHPDEKIDKMNKSLGRSQKPI